MNKPQQLNLQVDLSQTEPIICEACSNQTFQQVVLMRRISALLSPTGQEALVPIPVFECASCGHINSQFYPTDLKPDSNPKQESNIVMP